MHQEATFFFYFHKRAQQVGLISFQLALIRNLIRSTLTARILHQSVLRQWISKNLFIWFKAIKNEVRFVTALHMFCILRQRGMVKLKGVCIFIESHKFTVLNKSLTLSTMALKTWSSYHITQVVFFFSFLLHKRKLLLKITSIVTASNFDCNLLSTQEEEIQFNLMWWMPFNENKFEWKQ